MEELTLFLRLFVLRHCRHKSQSRNADYILIAAERPPQPSESSESSEPFEPEPQSGSNGDTTTLSGQRAVAPSIQPAAEGGPNLRRQARPLY